MNTSGEAAEYLVRMYLEGAEVSLKIAGSAAKNIAAALMALSKDPNFKSGKTKLAKMIRSGKELKIFTMREKDYDIFKKEAKNYGVSFACIKRKKNNDGFIDIMVKVDDANKVTRINERFNMCTPDNASIKREIEKDKEKSQSNPNLAKAVKNPQSEPISKDLKISEKGNNLEKPSVREKIKKIKGEMDKESKLNKSEKEKKFKNKKTEYIKPSKRKEKKKER